jgi:tRNA threonylcarbamoyladenosine biosynthesis protein TsaB
MNLLAIDTAASALSVAVATKDGVHSADTEAGTRHSEIVMDCIDAVMIEAGLAPNELDGVLCMGGPGSFTGLRIGYSIAKGLALALNIPFAPVPTLGCIALPYSVRTLVMPVITARKTAFFCARYCGRIRLGPDRDSSTDEIAAIISRENNGTEKTLLTGPGAAVLYNALSEECKSAVELINENRGYAKELIEIARIDNLFCMDNSARLYEGPEYLRKSDAEISNLIFSTNHKA